DCAEPLQKSDSTPPSEDDEVYLEFPVSGPRKTWALTKGKLREYHSLYGEQLDVKQEARKARQWCEDNSSKRKTPRGMPAFAYSAQIGQEFRCEQVHKSALRRAAVPLAVGRLSERSDGGRLLSP